MIWWFTGNTESGKTFLARRVRRTELHLDGDDLRVVWPGLGFSKEDRWEHNLRVARLAKLLESQGCDVIVSTICPYKELRDEIRKIAKVKFIHVEGGKEGPDYPYESVH